ncbi:glycosyltransferase [Sulfitobacter sp. SK012]|uniref:glycosyltransferase n=1 Tax=Sulfitobacter sp. SK012 TaxID=1389005 RepID=UPI0020C7C05B|nr:glycosyltransferase [Sulfitobacter sp. SK012]
MTLETTSNAGRLVAVVVTFNRLAQLKITLERLLGVQADHLAAVVVVNNASTDDTAAWLESQTNTRLNVITSSKNLGGAGGFEIGMRHAMEQLSPDWIVVMDDDARPEPACFVKFHSAPRSSHWGWSAAVYHPCGKICDMNRPAINPFWHWDVFKSTLTGGRNGFHLSEPEYEAAGSRDIDVASFVGFFIAAEAVRQIGLPDGKLFIYGDDVLYSLRLRQADGRIAFDPNLRFEHDFSTIEDGEKRFRPLWKCYYHHRNLLMVYRVAAGWFFVPVLLIVIPKWLLKVSNYTGEKRAFMGLMMRAIWHGLRRHTDVTHPTVVAWSTSVPAKPGDSDASRSNPK